jgi:hypothetical protein
LWITENGHLASIAVAVYGVALSMLLRLLP